MRNINFESWPKKGRVTISKVYLIVVQLIKRMTTENPFFSVFKNHSDHNKWEKQIEFAKLYEISEEDRKEWIQALSFLQQELGNGFLKQRNHHPIHNLISNKAQIKELIEFTKTLQTLKTSDCNYEILRRKLKSKELCMNEGFPFSDIAKWYINAGFNVKFLEEEKTKKTPDIEITNPINNDKFYIEVSKVNEGNERTQRSQNYDILFTFFVYNKSPMPYSCHQLEYMDEHEMAKTLEIINKLKENALKNESIEVFENSKIKVAIAHPEKTDELEAWCKANKQRLNLVGLSHNFDDTNRIKNTKIKDKAKQLPKEYPGLIYIIVNPLYFWMADIQSAANNLAAELNKYANVLGIVIYSYIGDEGQNGIVSTSKNHFYVHKMIHDRHKRYLFMVLNDKFDGPINDDTIEKLYKTFL